MIILNIDLGEELEKEFYKKVRNKNISYLDYVQQLIVDDLKLEENKNEDNDFTMNIKNEILKMENHL